MAVAEGNLQTEPGLQAGWYFLFFDPLRLVIKGSAGQRKRWRQSAYPGQTTSPWPGQHPRLLRNQLTIEMPRRVTEYGHGDDESNK
jgi:hypothetical protein